MSDFLDELRPRYRDMTDPHDRPWTRGAPPAIQLIDYMGDADSYFETNLIGPYPDVAARDRDLMRLMELPLGSQQFNGGFEFTATTLGDPGEDTTVVAPEQVAAATTVRGFFAAFHGYTEEDDEGDAADPDEGFLYWPEPVPRPRAASRREVWSGVLERGRRRVHRRRVAP